MNKNEFVKQLRVVAEVLKPLAAVPHKTAENVNCATVPGRIADPDARIWQVLLLVLAGFIDDQDSSLSDKQLASLKRLLFGGMGSLNDLSFDPKVDGEIAKVVNDNLGKQRQELYRVFQGTVDK